MDMPGGGKLELRFSPQGEFDLLRWHNSFFNNPMRNDHCLPTMKEVKHAIIDALKADAKLVNPIAQKISLRASEFMAKLMQAFQADTALVLCLGRKGTKPLQKRHGAISRPKENKPRYWHSPAELRKFAEC